MENNQEILTEVHKLPNGGVYTLPDGTVQAGFFREGEYLGPDPPMETK